MGSTGVESIKTVELPEWMTGPNGELVTMMQLPDTSRGQVHILTCSGIGDTAWVWAKYWKLHEDLKAVGRELIFHFPDDPYHRVGPYAQLVGMNVGEYMPIDIRRLLSYPGELAPADFESGGIFYVHANRHLEEGKKLVDWHPWLPFKNPAPPIIEIGLDDTPPNTGVNDGVWRFADPKRRKPYVVVHMASETYCEGNYFPRTWARMIEWIEKHVAPVRLIGAKWDEGMIGKVTEYYTPTLMPCIGQSFATALSVIANSTCMMGVDSGLTIIATYYGVPCLRAYPRWLHRMIGTWEADAHPHTRALHMDELWDEYSGWFDGLTATT